jgi:hypothetical protein
VTKQAKMVDSKLFLVISLKFLAKLVKIAEIWRIICIFVADFDIF